MKTIALEIGSYAIKVLKIVSSFRTLEIADFSYHPLDLTLPEGEAQKKALAAIIQQHALEGDRVIVAFPGENCSSKMIQLPFRDRKKIIQALPFELEEQIPFPLEEIVWGWTTTAEEEKKTEILCIFSSKASTETYLHELQQQGIDPDVLQPAPLSFAPLCDYRFTPSSENFAIVDVGHKRTQMAFFLERKLTLVRTIMVGGHDVTSALMQSYRLSYEEAEKHKKEM